MPHLSRVDLHVHTHHSDLGDDWFLRVLNSRECYTTPQQVYDRAKKAGMDFVTITDHDQISGALEIAHLPNAFVSEEITAFFPEDQCKIHVLAYGINEAHHQEFQKLRRNVYELAAYLNRQNIVHAIAHPFFSMSKCHSIEHVEKMLLLFKIIEVKNGGKQMYPDDLLLRIIAALTPASISRLAEKHRLEPVGESPWQKSVIGGSDDHAGIFISKPHTACPRVETVAELLAALRAGASEVIGEAGSPQVVAHSIYSVGYKHIRSRARGRRSSGAAWTILDHVLMQKPRPSKIRIIVSMAIGAAKSRVRRKRSNFSPLIHEAGRLLREHPEWRRTLFAAIPADQCSALQFEDGFHRLWQSLLYHELRDTLQRGLADIPARVQRLGALAGVIAPYVIGYHTESRDRELMREARRNFLGATPKVERNKTAWLVDGWSRMSRARQRMIHRAARLRGNVTLITTGDAPQQIHADHAHFTALGGLELPGGAHLKIDVPPIMEIVKFCASESFTEIGVLTPGPMGLLGIGLAHVLRMPLVDTVESKSLRYWVYTQTLPEPTGKLFKSYLTWFHKTTGERLQSTPDSSRDESLALPFIQPQDADSARMRFEEWMKEDLSGQ